MRAEALPETRRGSAPGHRTRVLIVDRDPAAVAAIRSIFRSQGWEVISAKTGAEGLDKTRAEGPDAIVTEMNLADMGAPDLCRVLRLRSDSVNTPVIVLSANSGVAERVASLRAGAADYLVKPPDAQELIARLRAALDLRRERAGFVIAVCSGKGGVGVSTMAVNLAVVLRRETRGGVALLDAGMHMGAADIMLNLQARPGVDHLLAHLDEIEDSDFETILTPHASGVQVLLLHEEGLGVVEVEELRQLLFALRRLRDFVVVDVPSSFDDNAAAILEVADRVVLVLTPEITALRGAKLFLEWALQMGLPEQRILTVLNRFPQRGGLQRRAVENALGMAVEALVADDVKLVSYGINRGVPLVQSHRRSKVARQVSALAKALVKVAQSQ